MARFIQHTGLKAFVDDELFSARPSQVNDTVSVTSEIRQLYKKWGWTQKQLMGYFGVTRHSLRKILHSEQTK